MSRFNVWWAACLILLGGLGCNARSQDLAEFDWDADTDEEVDEQEGEADSEDGEDGDGESKEEDGESEDEASDGTHHGFVAISDPLSYYEHAKPIIDAKCASCHTEDGIGPMPLTSYDEVEPYVKLVEASVASGRMPPWTAEGPLDNFLGDRRLSFDQRRTLLSWLSQGAPEGDPEDEPEEKIDTTPRRLEDVDLRLELPIDYEPKVEPDDYHCFPIEWPEDETKYVTALDIVPGNRRIVHHAIIYYVRPGSADAVRERDAEEEGPGFECFGSNFGAPSVWLQSYEPGGYAQEVPGDLGFEIEPGSIMMLQLHYNTLTGSGTDRSAMEFKLEDKVDRVGRVSLIMQPAWIAGFMPIPANEPDVVHNYLALPRGADSPPREIFWADLHMHSLGTRGMIGIVRAERPGIVEPLLVIPEWDFAWQETYILREPVILNPLDRLYVECHFDNTADNQVMVDGERLPPRDVNWGDGTTDEMCLGNVLTAPIELGD